MERRWEYNAPAGHRLLEGLAPGGKGFSLGTNRLLVLILTFLCYTAYHASRKPPSIVKSVLHGESPTEFDVSNDRLRNLLMAVEHRGMLEKYGMLDTTFPSNMNNRSSQDFFEDSSFRSGSAPASMMSTQASGGDEVTQAASAALSRKLLEDVEKKRHKHKPSPEPTPEEDAGWSPFNNPHNGKSLLGDLDLAFLGSYALGMFISGHLGDRVDLRHFLTGGMLGSGACVALFGAAYFLDIHVMSYFLAVQVVGGLLQATGWPSVVSVMANWFGKGKRGLIMGVWNAHTSVGNIAGSLIAAAALRYGWGWSFIVPGAMIAGVGVLIFLFLVVEPQDIGFVPQSGSALGSALATPAYVERPTGLTAEDREYMERRLALLAREHGGMVPARVAASMEAHHHLHPPTGQHGLLAMGSTLVMMDTDRDSIEGDSDEETEREALLASGEFRRAPRREVPGVSFFSAWCVPGVATYAFTLFFAKLVAYTFLYWLPYYINATEVGGKQLTPSEAGNLSILFDVGGVLGGVLAGYLSDLLRAPAVVSCTFVYLAIPFLYMYRAFGSVSFLLNVSLMMSAGFFVNGPYALITTAVSADLGSSVGSSGNEKALATITAIIDGMGSIGAALGPVLTGYISELPGGFDNVFLMLYIAALCAGLLLSRLVLREIGELRSMRRSSGGAGHDADENADAFALGRVPHPHGGKRRDPTRKFPESRYHRGALPRSGLGSSAMSGQSRLGAKDFGGRGDGTPPRGPSPRSSRAALNPVEEGDSGDDDRLDSSDIINSSEFPYLPPEASSSLDGDHANFSSSRSSTKPPSARSWGITVDNERGSLVPAPPKR